MIFSVISSRKMKKYEESAKSQLSVGSMIKSRPDIDNMRKIKESKQCILYLYNHFLCNFKYILGKI